MKLEIKEVASMTIFCYETKTNIAGLFALAGHIDQELRQEADKLKLEITGPSLWIYDGMDGNPATTFKLKMAVPVKASIPYNGKFTFVQLPVFKCASTIHHGPWQQLSEVYPGFMAEISENNLTPTQINREIYLTIDLKNPENNITELQKEIR